MLRFIHSSDLHLGKRFGALPEGVRGRLTEARHLALGRLAALARETGAQAVLVAGDVFDVASPAPETLRHALAAMADDPGVQWVLLPGNHDPAGAEALWEEMARRKPDNVTLALEPAPLPLGGAVILPAPCPVRRPGVDLTGWMDDAATPEGALRIGLAHGPVQSFGEEEASDIIAPDRPARAGLNYLALGDWHGTLRIGERLWYSGTPEPDRFRHDAPGAALVITLPAAGAVPQVEVRDLGAFRWAALDLDLYPGDDVLAALTAALPSARQRETLVDLRARGRLSLSEAAAFRAGVAELAPDFAYLALDTTALAQAHDGADLDAVAASGPLRQAAEALLADADDPDRPEGERRAAADALALLHGFAVADGDAR